MDKDSTHQLPTIRQDRSTNEKMSTPDVESFDTSPADMQRSATRAEISAQRTSSPIPIHALPHTNPSPGARWIQSLNPSIDHWLTLPTTAVNFQVFLNLAKFAVTLPQAAKLLRLAGIFITRIFDNDAMPLCLTIQQILSSLGFVGEAENFATLLRKNGFPGVGSRDAAALMEQLARFLPRIKELEGIPTEVVKESSTESKGKEGGTTANIPL